MNKQLLLHSKCGNQVLLFEHQKRKEKQKNHLDKEKEKRKKKKKENLETFSYNISEFVTKIVQEIIIHVPPPSVDKQRTYKTPKSHHKSKCHGHLHISMIMILEY